MMVLLGDVVTIQREIGGEVTWVTGRISGIVQRDNGDLKYFCIKGIDDSFWVSDGWKFSEEIEEDDDDAEI
jgi:hypothetical protein